MIQNSQLIDDELLRLRSFVAMQQNAIEDSQEVIDSFAPRCPYLTQAERDGDFELNSELEIAFSLAPDDEGHHATLAENPPSPPRDQRENNLSTRLQSLTGTVESEHSSGKSCRWQIGGRKGLVDNRYIDWALRKDQRIELIVGQIEALDGADDEAANQEWETKLILNPETRRYWFSVEPRARFWVFDSATRQLNRIVELSRIGQLESSQALVVTTANLPETLVIELGEADVWGNESFENADDLAQTLQEALELTEPLLVLHRVS